MSTAQFFLKSRPMTDFQRVKQWLVFARQWHLVDANGQDLDLLGKKVHRYLIGAHKPIYHPLCFIFPPLFPMDEKRGECAADCGDHVVVINCNDVALKAFDWRRRDYFYDRDYPKSKALLPAYEIHQADPCRLMFHTVYHELATTHKTIRKSLTERLHLFSGSEIPPQILGNVADQMEQVQAVPKRLEDYTPEERASFPRLVKLPPDFPLNEEELHKTPPS